MSKEKQVIVRFESTVENKENETSSYARIVPFKKVDQTTEEFKDWIDYYTIEDNIYTPALNLTEFDSSVDYYIRRYHFSPDIQYYTYEDEEFVEIEVDDKEVRSDIEYFLYNTTFLFSGPVDIFATVDVLWTDYSEYDDYGKTSQVVYTAHPTKEEMQNEEYFTDGEFDIDLYTETTQNKIGLYSPYIANLASEYLGTNDKNVIIFVEDVRGPRDSQTHRGAYFLYQGCEYDEDGFAIGKWQEILLGTHSHPNLPRLNAFTELYSEEDSLLLLNADGGYTLVPYSSLTTLPALPKEIQDLINTVDKYTDLEEPDSSEWNHLDAPLSMLDDTLDWASVTSGKNLAVGNCRELYRALLMSEKKLYITSDLEITFDNESGSTLPYVNLAVYSVNFDDTQTIDGIYNVTQSPTNSKFDVISFDFKNKLYNSDLVYIFRDGQLLTKECEIIEKNLNSITVLFNKYYSEQFENNPSTITLLFVYDSAGIDGFSSSLAQAFEEGTLKLEVINNRLVSAYVENYFSKKPNVPKLYLTTDDYGRIVWDNKLLPAQYFYVETQTITADYVSQYLYNEKVRVIFKNVDYKVNEDFPLILINELFAFNIVPDASSGEDLIFYFPYNGGDAGYSFELDEDETLQITLVLIRKASAGSIAGELARNYVSKEDAVAILTHGKINLSDYATQTELRSYSKIGHTHSQYALKDHNHDFRYANFHHTHPELVLLLMQLSNTEYTQEQIQEWIDELVDMQEQHLIDLIEKELGITPNEDGSFDIKDLNTVVSEEILNLINKKIVDEEIDLGFLGTAEDYETDEDGYPVVTEKVYLDQVLQYIVKFFEIDIVYDDQVLLSDPILARHNVGGIKIGKFYERGTDLRQILTDMFNPYVTLEEAIAILTPVEIELEWYYKYIDADENEEFVKIDEKRMLRFLVENDYNKEIYFKIVGCKNKYGEDCRLMIDRNGERVEEKTIIHHVLENDPENGVKLCSDEYHVYSLEEYLDLEDLPNITFTWTTVLTNKEEDIIYDNYGINFDHIDMTQNIMSLIPELAYGAPVIFVGTISTSVIEEAQIYQDDLTTSDNILNYKNLRASFLDNPLRYTCDLTDGNKFIVLLVRKDIAKEGQIVIKDDYSGTRIEQFFRRIPASSNSEYVVITDTGAGEIEYAPYTYEVYSTLFKYLKIRIHLLEENLEDGGISV